MSQIGTPVEYRRFPDADHGFGAGIETSAEGRIAQAERFCAAHLQIH